MFWFPPLLFSGAAGARELKRRGLGGEIGSEGQGPVAQVTQIATGR